MAYRLGSDVTDKVLNTIATAWIVRADTKQTIGKVRIDPIALLCGKTEVCLDQLRVDPVSQDGSALQVGRSTPSQSWQLAGYAGSCGLPDHHAGVLIVHNKAVRCAEGITLITFQNLLQRNQPHTLLLCILLTHAALRDTQLLPGSSLTAKMRLQEIDWLRPSTAASASPPPSAGATRSPAAPAAPPMVQVIAPIAADDPDARPRALIPEDQAAGCNVLELQELQLAGVPASYKAAAAAAQGRLSVTAGAHGVLDDQDAACWHAHVQCICVNAKHIRLLCSVVTSTASQAVTCELSCHCRAGDPSNMQPAQPRGAGVPRRRAGHSRW